MKIKVTLPTGDVLDIAELSEKIARRIVSLRFQKTGQNIAHRIPDLREEAQGGISLAIASGETDTRAIVRAGFKESQRILRYGSRETESLTAYSETAAAREMADLPIWGDMAIRYHRARIIARARQLVRAARRARAQARSNKGGRADMALRADLRLIRRATAYMMRGQLEGDTFSFREATPHASAEKSRLSTLYKQYARFFKRVLAFAN